MAATHPHQPFASLSVEIVRLSASSDLTAVRSLFSELRVLLLSKGVPIDSFQGFEDEIAGLPGKYAEEKGGCLLVAQQPAAAGPSTTLGCVAFKDIGEGVCEMKRMFVSPTARGLRLGQRLSIALLDVARERGYRVMKLDTLDRLPEACALYERLGFTRTEPYVFNPMPDVRYYSLDLGLAPGAAAAVLKPSDGSCGADAVPATAVREPGARASAEHATPGSSTAVVTAAS